MAKQLGACLLLLLVASVSAQSYVEEAFTKLKSWHQDVKTFKSEAQRFINQAKTVPATMFQPLAPAVGASACTGNRECTVTIGECASGYCYYADLRLQRGRCTIGAYTQQCGQGCGGYPGSPNSCQSGMSCLAVRNNDGNLIGSRCGTLLPTTCGCTSGTGCASGRCVNNICTYPYMAGDLCDTSAQCATGSTCSGGRCTGLAQGAACDWGNGRQCNRDLYCRRNSINTNAGICQPRVNSGAACDLETFDDDGCKGGEFCDVGPLSYSGTRVVGTGVCRRIYAGRAGATCSNGPYSTLACAPGLACRSGICTASISFCDNDNGCDIDRNCQCNGDAAQCSGQQATNTSSSCLAKLDAVFSCMYNNSVTSFYAGNFELNDLHTSIGGYCKKELVELECDSQCAREFNPNVDPTQPTSLAQNCGTPQADLRPIDATRNCTVCTPVPGSDDKNYTNYIIGGVIGGIAFIALVYLGIKWIKERRAANRPPPSDDLNTAM